MGEDGISALACGDVQHVRLQHCVMISRGDTVRGITIRFGAAIGDSRCKSIIESKLMSSFFLPEMGIGIFIAECLAECCCFVHGRQLSTFLWLILSCFLWPIEKSASSSCGRQSWPSIVLYIVSSSVSIAFIFRSRDRSAPGHGHNFSFPHKSPLSRGFHSVPQSQNNDIHVTLNPTEQAANATAS